MENLRLNLAELILLTKEMETIVIRAKTKNSKSTRSGWELICKDVRILKNDSDCIIPVPGRHKGFIVLL